MSTSPSPEDRAQKDKELKAREAEEQARLPYKWTQQIGDLDLTIPVAGNIKGRDIEVVLTKTKLKAALKGQEPFIDVNPPLALQTLVFSYKNHSVLQRSFLLICSRLFLFTGRTHEIHSPGRINLDTGNGAIGQGNQYPSGQDQQNGVVGCGRQQCALQDRYLEDHAREQ